MVILLIIIAFVIASTVFVIAAGVLSSRLSRQEEWNEPMDSFLRTSPTKIKTQTEHPIAKDPVVLRRPSDVAKGAGKK